MLVSGTTFSRNFWKYLFREFLKLLTNNISAEKLGKESLFVCWKYFLCKTIRLRISYLIINKNRAMGFGPGLQELVDRMFAW
jgi:hypothetical protein